MKFLSVTIQMKAIKLHFHVGAVLPCFLSEAKFKRRPFHAPNLHMQPNRTYANYQKQL